MQIFMCINIFSSENEDGGEEEEHDAFFPRCQLPCPFSHLCFFVEEDLFSDDKTCV